MRRAFLVWALFSLAAVVFYRSALDNPLLFDDEKLIAGNSRLAWSEARRLAGGDYFGFFPGHPVSYRPVNTLSYIANASLFGERYALWRLSYLLLHALNAALVYLFLTARGVALGPFPALAAASLFLLHPLHSEVVNAISFSEEIVMGFFLLVSWNCVLRAEGARRRVGAAAASAAFAAALLSKETALFFPAVVLAWTHASARTPGDGPGPAPGRWSLPLAMAVTSAVFVLLRFLVLVNPLETGRATPAGAPEALRGFLRDVADYGLRFLWPRSLSAAYENNPAGWASPPVLAGLFLVLALAVSIPLLWKRRRTAAIAALWLLASLFYLPYLAALSPPWGAYAYDRYLYVPAMGLAWILAEALSRLAPARPRPIHALAGGGAVLLVVFFFHATIQERNRVWSGNLELWRDVVAKEPRAGFGHFNLGVSLREAGDAEGARRSYEEALRLGFREPDVYFNLGNLRFDGGDLAAAAELYGSALRSDPGHGGARLNLGNVLYQEQRFGEAAAHYRAALAVDPRDALAWNNLGWCLLRLGDPGEAAGAFREALSLDPGYAAARRGLDRALAGKGAVEGGR